MATKYKKNRRGTKEAHRIEKEAKQEKLTNWYMITLSFGVLAIAVLLIFRQMYRTTSMLEYMPAVTWTMFGIFAASAVAVLALGLSGIIKNKQRAVNYTVFLGVCALGSLWLALFNRIRLLAENIIIAVSGNQNLTINSHWNINALIILTVAYLIAAFIYYIIKLYKIK